MESSSEAESVDDEEPGHGSVIDMEDLGNVMNLIKKVKVTCQLCRFLDDYVAPYGVSLAYRSRNVPNNMNVCGGTM